MVVLVIFILLSQRTCTYYVYLHRGTHFKHCQIAPDIIRILHQISYVYCTRYHTYTAPDIIRIVHQISYVYCTRYHTYTAPDIIRILHQISYVYCTRYHTYTAPDIIRILHQISYVYCTRYHTYTAPDIIRVHCTSLLLDCSGGSLTWPPGVWLARLTREWLLGMMLSMVGGEFHLRLAHDWP